MPIKIAQGIIPATPTALPPAPIAPVTINENAYRIWRYTDEALMVWQQIGPSRTQVFQVAIILVIVIAAVYMIYRWVSALVETQRTRNV